MRRGSAEGSTPSCPWCGVRSAPVQPRGCIVHQRRCKCDRGQAWPWRQVRQGAQAMRMGSGLNPGSTEGKGFKAGKSAARDEGWVRWCGQATPCSRVVRTHTPRSSRERSFQVTTSRGAGEEFSCPSPSGDGFLSPAKKKGKGKSQGSAEGSTPSCPFASNPALRECTSPHPRCEHSSVPCPSCTPALSPVHPSTSPPPFHQTPRRGELIPRPEHAGVLPSYHRESMRSHPNSPIKHG